MPVRTLAAVPRLSQDRLGAVRQRLRPARLSARRSRGATALAHRAQLLDAVAVGQVTPGPVFTTATFIGYLLAGRGGAAVATIGIFLPAFVFVALSGPLIPRFGGSPIAGALLDGVNVASLALMSVVTWLLARSAIVNVTTALVAIVSAVLLFRYRINPRGWPQVGARRACGGWIR